MILSLIEGQYKNAGSFVDGELAIDEQSGEIYLCVDTDTHSPQAFRCIFKCKYGKPNKWTGVQEKAWVPCFGSLKRFGYNKELAMVSVQSPEWLS